MSTLHTNEPMQGLAQWLRESVATLHGLSENPACREHADTAAMSDKLTRWAEAVESLAAQAKAPASVQDTAPSEKSESISSDRASTAGSGVADAAPLREGVTVGEPVGWQLVPVKPTREMLLAVDEEADDKYVARGRALSAWASMLAAAPIPQQAAPAITDERIAQLADKHFGKFEFITDAITFARAILAEASHKKE